MSEWKEYTGSEEQIEEISKAKSGIALIFAHSKKSFVYNLKDISTTEGVVTLSNTVTHYLICNPHPLEDMICQQARTGQEVWVLEPIVGTEDHPLWPRLLAEGINRDNVGAAILAENGIFWQYSTRTPYWHIHDAQYSFTRFGGYRANK